MNALRPLFLTAVLLAAAIGFGIGKILTAPSAQAAATHRKIVTWCRGCRGRAQESSACTWKVARRDKISIWKAGNPDQPAWSGKP